MQETPNAPRKFEPVPLPAGDTEPPEVRQAFQAVAAMEAIGSIKNRIDKKKAIGAALSGGRMPDLTQFE